MKTDDIVVTLPKGRRVHAQVGRHVVMTDQPLDNGGEDSAPSPFDLFLASVGTCAGIFVQGFCARRNIDSSRIRIIQKMNRNEATELIGIELQIEVPADFPAQYRQALVQVVEQCSVKKAVLRGLQFQTVVGELQP
jgi:putative redox protein